MSNEVDRYTSAWAHIALCADLTWTTEPPDEFIIANQRLWAQNCRVSQALKGSTDFQSLSTNIQSDSTDKSVPSNQSQESSSSNRLCVSDVIPESRLAQYGNYYYDDSREKCYTNLNEKSFQRGYNEQRYENSDVTECWMLPEVEYWFQKFLDEPLDTIYPKRQRPYRKPVMEDFERWVPNAERVLTTKETGGDEAALAAKVQAVRQLWLPLGTRSPSPPPLARKMRARRRQPRRLAHFGSTTLNYHLDSPAPLTCDPSCKFQFKLPRLLQQKDNQRIIERLPANVQAVMRASVAKSLPYRGTNVSRYAATAQRPLRGPERRYGVYWPRDHASSSLEIKFRLPQTCSTTDTKPPQTSTSQESTEEAIEMNEEEQHQEISNSKEDQQSTSDSPRKDKADDDQVPSTSTAVEDLGAGKKRLYSTVLSMSAPPPMTMAQVGCVRLAQKVMTPGLLKLNPKIVLQSTRARPANSENKFEELEKEALEQYKASDESIDSKFRELEKQAVEQYSTSNSNTSCSSGHCEEKLTAISTSNTTENKAKDKKQPAKFQKQESVVIYSQNFPDLKSKAQTTSGTDLKNLHNPPRGDKKEQAHRSSKARSIKSDSQRAASDTDYETKESNFKGTYKGTRWTLHFGPPKKRHPSLCVSDFSSDDDIADAPAVTKHGNPCAKNRLASKLKLSAHGGGDLQQPITRKTQHR